MDWFHTREQNAALRATNAELGEQNAWLYDYALEGDALLAEARAQVADPQAEQLAAALFESERELETMWRERDDARAQRDRLNEQCDTLTREAAEQIGELHRLLLEATLARDDYRARYEQLQHDSDCEAASLRRELAKLSASPPPETQYAVKPKVPRRPRGKEAP